MDVYATEQVVFPEYIRPLLMSSRYSLALFIYKSPCWDLLFNDASLNSAQKIDIRKSLFNDF